MKKYFAIGLIVALAVITLSACSAKKAPGKNSDAGSFLYNVKYMQSTAVIAKTKKSASVPTVSEYGLKTKNDIPYLLFNADGKGKINVNYLDGVTCYPMSYKRNGNIITISYSADKHTKYKIAVKEIDKSTLKCTDTYQSKTGMTLAGDIFHSK